MSIPTADNGWVSAPDPCPSEVLERAWQIMETTLYCTLSTCSPDGLPWVSPVFFCHQNLNLYWASAIASRHSQNLYQNGGRIAIAIYNSQAKEGTAKGLYFSGTAAEVPPEQVRESMTLLFRKAGGDPLNRTEADYLGASPRRLYCFQPKEAWVSGDRLPIGKQLVDTKIQLKLRELLDFPGKNPLTQ